MEGRERPLLGGKVEALEKRLQSVSHVLSYVGMSMLFLLMLLGAADVIGRYFLGKPILGTLEISQILLAAVVFFGWPYTQALRRHIRADFVTSRYPRRVQLVTDLIAYLVALVLFSLVVWRGTIVAITALESNRMIMLLNVPIFPFQLLAPFGALVVCLVVISQILMLLRQMRSRV